MPPVTALPSAAANVSMKPSRSTMAASPDAGRGGAAGVIGKLARSAAERALDAVAERGVAAGEHGCEQVADQVGGLDRHALAQQGRAVILLADLGEGDVASGQIGDLAGRLGKAQRSRAGDVIEF